MNTVAGSPNRNTSPTTERRLARLRPITTLRVGEMVTLVLRGKQVDTLNCWAGRVLAADGVAIRLDVTLRRFDWSWQAASGEEIVPWARVDHAQVWVDL